MEAKTHTLSRCGQPEFCLFFERGLKVGDQLKGFSPGYDFTLFDRDADEIERLKARGLITQPEVDRAHDRLVKRIYNALRVEGLL